MERRKDATEASIVVISIVSLCYITTHDVIACMWKHKHNVCTGRRCILGGGIFNLELVVVLVPLTFRPEIPSSWGCFRRCSGP